MEWVKDRSGRFLQRPFYTQDELDYECESLVASFLTKKHGAVNFPIHTNDLTILLERDTDDMDIYADLTTEGAGVEGVTDFFARSKPKVRISQKLQAPNLENRLRTTLTHELGHVKLHGFIWTFGQMSMFANPSRAQSPRCKRETILGASYVDWLEWQAGYASGAYLMPLTPLRRVVQEVSSMAEPIASDAGQAMIQKVKETFQVSEDAARVRLLKLAYLTEKAAPMQQLRF